MTECILWTGPVDKHGYGLLPGGFGMNRHIHRKTYIDAHGPIPAAVKVRATCGDKRCYNLDHLVAERPKPKAKPAAPPRPDTSERDLAIFERYQRGGTSYRLLGRRYGLSEHQVYSIVKRGSTSATESDESVLDALR